MSVKTATEISEAIFTAKVTRAGAAILYQGVFRPKGRLSVRIDVFDRQVGKKR